MASGSYRNTGLHCRTDCASDLRGVVRSVRLSLSNNTVEKANLIVSTFQIRPPTDPDSDPVIKRYLWTH